MSVRDAALSVLMFWAICYGVIDKPESKWYEPHFNLSAFHVLDSNGEQTMSEKTVVNCDGRDCDSEHEHHGGDFMICDITGIGWSYDEINEFHYCPSCVVKLKSNGEL